VVACIGLGALGVVLVTVRNRGWTDGIEASFFLLVLAVLAGWLVWKLMRTVWLVILANDIFTFLATGARWTFEPGDITKVTGDAYNQFLVVASNQGKVWIWAHLNDCASLLSAIRRANPEVEFDQWVQNRAH
jgi:hypothetical protein